MKTVLNMYRVHVRKWCASCKYKEVMKDGTRVCTKMQLKVPQDLVCQKWQMSDGLKNAGLLAGGVVRLKGTTEIVIK